MSRFQKESGSINTAIGKRLNMAGHEETLDLFPSEKEILSTGPAKPPKISNSSGIKFPNLHVICGEPTGER